MTTRVLKVDPWHPEARAIADAASVLRGGGLVAFPTETVYGLGARVSDPAALARVFAAKGRPRTHPLIAHVAGESEARELATAWTPSASRLARAFWPGPLTLVVPRAAAVPALVSGGGDSIAVRAPSHAVARALLDELGEPIAAPSANRYQSLSPTRAEHVLSSLPGLVDLVLDGGPCPAGIESTVVDVRGDAPVVLRPGAIDLVRLRAVEPLATIGRPMRHEPAEAGEPRPSPGMDPRHYAPRATVVMARDHADACGDARGRAARGERVGLLLCGEGRAWRKEVPSAGAAARAERDGEEGATSVIALARDPALYAQRFYAALHDLDDRVDVIVIEPVPEGEPWRAIRDRLRRASS